MARAWDPVSGGIFPGSLSVEPAGQPTPQRYDRSSSLETPARRPSTPVARLSVRCQGLTWRSTTLPLMRCSSPTSSVRP